MKKVFYFLYAVIGYLVFFATFLYLIAFVENLQQTIPQLRPIMHQSLDIGTSKLPLMGAIVVNLLLIALFGLQHSVMARLPFKEKWTRTVPKPIERSTYVLLTSIALMILFWGWQPLYTSIWDLSGTIAGKVFFALSLIGWCVVLISTFLINHFDLFGLRQPYLYLKGKESVELAFRKPGFYQVIRHPIYFGFMLAFWFAPKMTLGHLVFALGMTIYIFIGIYHEEKDLIRLYGDVYRKYRQNTPKIMPFLNGTSKNHEIHS